MKISIITVCFNAADTIADTLRSVAEQDYPDIEHIVVDGASRDGTQSIVQGLSQRVARFVSERDRGIYDAMNKGMALATGEVVAYLNADDVYAHAGVVRRVVEVFQDPKVDACYANLVYVDRSRAEQVVRVWRSRDFRPGLFRRGWMPAHPTLFVRREPLLATGGFDIRFRQQADFDLTLRLFELQRIRSRFIPEFWVRMREGGASNASWRHIVKGNLEAWRICWKNGFRVGPWFMLIKVASRLGQFRVRAADLKALERQGTEAALP
ncbi:glycosyltransferase family 2 protein [Uliginosibacterium sp. H1]|uniref:glycosyltransferase family 2 protein n=1 Tax=Uliginosibacterium sp. H1 TaxID=3114757 RepID=UPI002E189201|nr:glycosyltransferase family 2 protein [Uliginosibacterium sp. H1]